MSALRTPGILDSGANINILKELHPHTLTFHQSFAETEFQCT